ncbi:SRPBCC family protein [Flavobacterium soyangense]|uniref:hypothetical protein n=1 Tax=Flavobacterium soyangense TaxID=2023265 RepID=UPI001E55441C|nr:hypothetical protein [Flavobacterium soyangense]
MQIVVELLCIIRKQKTSVFPITAKIEPLEAKGMTFKPKVLAFETNKEFRWLGHLLFPGLFDGEHKF